MTGAITITIIILACSISLAGALIYFGSSFSLFEETEETAFEAVIVEKITMAGYTRCVVEHDSIRYIVYEHVCVEAVGMPMNVTDNHGWDAPEDYLIVVKQSRAS